VKRQQMDVVRDAGGVSIGRKSYRQEERLDVVHVRQVKKTPDSR